MDNGTTIEQLFYKYKADVNNFLMYYLKTIDVDDAFQETFIHAHRALNQHVKIKNERSWLIAIARHVAIDYLRKEKSWYRHLMNIPYETIRRGQIPIEEKLQLNERKQTILNALYKLKHTYQEVIILRGFKELTVSETAEILEWNENKVRITYHRALKKLRDILGKEGENYDIG